jgi:SecD/SecF fusion protein
MLFHLLRQIVSSNSQSFTPLYLLGVLVIGIVLPFVIGRMIASRVRMADYAWRIGLILMTLVLSGEIVGRTWSPRTGNFDIKLGVDLQGGVILIYEVEQGVAVVADEAATEASEPSPGVDTSFRMGSLIEALSRRINPTGTKEIVIRPYGERQVEIIIPEVDQREVDRIKKTISTAGVLQFRIVANTRDHDDIINLATEMAKDPTAKRGRIIRDNQAAVGLWARVAREQKTIRGVRPFKVDVSGFTLRNASTGDLVQLPPTAVTGRDDDTRRQELAEYAGKEGIPEIDVLMATDDGCDVNGSHLGTVSRGYDEVMNPCIHFNLKGVGVGKFSDLSGNNAPEGQFHRQLGIVLDNELLSAPNIQERITGQGRITGQFTQEEVDFLVNILQAGSLPVVLNKNPIASDSINPLLGKETIERSKLAMVISLALVFLVVCWYYRFAGFIASVAMATNLLFILALMVLIKAALTLPGIAGLVLTVGMSIDANVLIYERMREEMEKGSTLRMAIRNGFSRATVTIIDSNLTTIITALVLYAIGTDQIRGFAVTLILGILISMFTAIFCTRVVFDICERSRWLTQLKMMQFFKSPNYDFISKQYICIACSILLIIIGLFCVVLRGRGIFDIDFNGGTSVHVLLQQPTETETVRQTLAKKFRAINEQFSLTGMATVGGSTANQIFKVDSSIPQVEDLERAILEAAQQSGGQVQLAMYSLERGPLRRVSVAAPAAPAEKPGTNAAAPPSVPEAKAEAGAPQANAPGGKAGTGDAPVANPQAPSPAPVPQPEANPPAAEKAAPAGDAGKQSSWRFATRETLVAWADELNPLLAYADPPASTSPVADAVAAPGPTAAPKTPEQPAPAATGEVTRSEQMEALSNASPPEAAPPAAKEAAPPAEKPAEPAVKTEIEVLLKFAYPINEETLRGEINDAAEELKAPISYFELTNPDSLGGSNAFQDWTLKIPASEEQTTVLLDHLAKRFAETPVWPSSSKIGSQVAGRMQRTAILALVVSWLGIIIYIWIRFQHLTYGLGAVVALIHDVMITIGFVAASTWLAPVFSFAGIEEFKINLTVVAAILTVIGYSVNDTIVVFDRIREVRGKSPRLTYDMANRSLNQTLSRTLLTGSTTMIVLVVLFGWGGDGIHAFCFTLLIGCIVGTFSSLYVATPFVLWLTGAERASVAKRARAGVPSAKEGK